jgi:putative endonuclease
MRAIFFIVQHYVYIIHSFDGSTYYKGYTTNPAKRLVDHNLGLSQYTSAKKPWKLVYVEELPTKRESLIRERKLKGGNKDYFESLILSEKNIVHKFV